MSKECPKCKSYKTIPSTIGGGLAFLTGGSCMFFTIILIPLAPFLMGIGILMFIVDGIMKALGKERGYYCMNCHYKWKTKK